MSDVILGLFRSAQDVTRYQSGDTIFAEGSVGDRMYVLRSGRVAVTVAGTLLEEVEPGGMFGEMVLLDKGAPRSATVVATTECEVIPVDERRFLFLVQQTPFFALEVMRIMAARLRARGSRIAGKG